MKLKCRSIELMLMGGLLAAGCHKEVPPPPPPPPVVWHVPDDRVDQVNEIPEHVDVIRNTVAGMIGQTRQQHQQNAETIFEALAKILRLAQGSSTTPMFDSRILIVDETNEVLAARNMTSSRAEAAENEGLRAAVNILERLASRDLPADTDLLALLDRASQKVEAMYSVSGPMHDLSAVEGYTALSQALNRMNTDYEVLFRNAENADKARHR